MYTESVLDHAVSSTCGGHVAIMTGRHPGPAGVADNRYVDRESMEVRFCVEDPREAVGVLGAREIGRAPTLFRVDALGDWLKKAQPDARVFSVSAKDRAAIAMGGQRADSAYWFDYERALGFTTSRYYRDALPDWVRTFNDFESGGPGLLGRVPATWEHEFDDRAVRIREDDYWAESDRYGRISGHPLASDDLVEHHAQVFASPFIDRLTLDFARKLVETEDLGSRGTPDLLAISLSGTDTVGHLYGPESHEARDGMRRLDGWLGEFIAFLEARVGPGGLVIALSADHGVLPLPERLAETGRSECPVEGGRAGLTWLAAKLFWRLHRELAPFFSFPAEWIRFSGLQATVNVPLATERGVDVEKIVRVAERQLESEPSIREVWTLDEIRERDTPLAQLYRNSLDPEKSGDLTVQFEPTCLISPFDGGTSHGSPYLYDRAVPLVFWGAGVEAGPVSDPASVVDLAPSLARWLGIEPPAGLDGKALLGVRPSH